MAGVAGLAVVLVIVAFGVWSWTQDDEPDCGPLATATVPGVYDVHLGHGGSISGAWASLLVQVPNLRPEDRVQIAAAAGADEGGFDALRSSLPADRHDSVDLLHELLLDPERAQATGRDRGVERAIQELTSYATTVCNVLP